MTDQAYTELKERERKYYAVKSELWKEYNEAAETWSTAFKDLERENIRREERKKILEGN